MHGTPAQVEAKHVTHIDAAHKEILGVSASLIPFVEKNRVDRSLMACAMQKQAVPLLRQDAPIVGTGIEREVAKNTSQLVMAKGPGVVKKADGDSIIVTYNSGGDVEYKLQHFEKTNDDRCYNQHCAVARGQKVKKGDAVTLTVDAIPGRTFTGKVNRLYPTIDAATHTFMAEVIVTNADKVLRPGMYARVTVTFGVNRSVIVPDQAIVKQEGTGQRFIYILNEDNTVSYVPVTLGRHLGNEYEVTEGLQAGQTVVSKGQVNLRDGIKVEVK